MKLTKKPCTLGDAAYGLTLTQDMLAQLGVNAAATLKDVSVTLTFYGDTLIARRAGAKRPTPAEVVYLLTDDLGTAKLFSTRSATPKADETYTDFEALFRLGVNLRLTTTMR